MNLVVVELPAKAKTINKYLGRGYEVLASFGHVRDLPAKDGSVDPDADFRMIWEVDAKAQKRLNDIARAAKGADKLILATDPDREGEAISWHVLEVLKQKKALNGQTDRARRVQRHHQAGGDRGDGASAPHRPGAGRRLSGAPRARLSGRLHAFAGAVAQAAGRALGRTGAVGGAAAGLRPRARDREIRPPGILVAAWRRWRRRATRRSRRASSAPTARSCSGSTSARAPRRRPSSRRSKPPPSRSPSVEAKPVKRHPQPPFTTSTLQQEASRKLGFAPAHTMRVAQRLYEGIDIGGESRRPHHLYAHRRRADRRRGDRRRRASVIEPGLRRAATCRDAPRRYETKAKNAQEAHEAIRPTDLTPPAARRQALPRSRPGQALRADLAAHRRQPDGIGRARAHHRRHHRARSASRLLELRATGTVVKFDGFLALYQEGQRRGRRRRGGAPAAADERRASALAKRAIAATQHFTEPPPRYSEASLVKRMEELGIGRPSTYASILQVLKDRKYVRLEKRRLHPGGPRAASSSPSSKAFSPNMSNTISPPASRKSSI